MTTLIQQRSPNDCVLASIAMAAGVERWADLWTEDDLAKCVADGGIRNESAYLERAGFAKTDYLSLRVWETEQRMARQMLWRRRALIACNSLNNHGGTHMVFWDGERIWDPHEGHWDQGLQHFRHLTSLVICELTLFNATPAA